MKPPETLKPQGGQGDPKIQAASLLSAQPTPVGETAGNPGEDVDTSGKKMRADYTEIGSTGLQQYGGEVYEEFLRALQGQRGIKTIREMVDNDPVIGAMLFNIEMLVRQVDWHLEPAFVNPPTPPAPAPPPMPVVGPGAQLPLIDAQGRQTAEQAEAEREHQRQQATQAQVAQIGYSATQAGGPGKRDQKNPIVKKSFHLTDDGLVQVDESASEHLNQVREAIAKALGEPVIGDANQVFQAEEAAAFVESCFLDMSSSWEDTLAAILSFIPYGWSYHELIYKRRLGPDQKDGKKRSRFDDGKVGWRKISLRSQDSKLRWEFDDSDGVKGMWQLAPGKHMTFLPIEKCLLFRTTSAKANPEGRPGVRNAFRPWFFKKRIEEIEATGIERDLAGLPVAWVPYEYMTGRATPEQVQVVEEIKRIVRNIKRDEQEGIVWPLAYAPDSTGGSSSNKLFDLTLLSTGGQRQFDTDKIIARYDQRIAMTMMADFILLGHEKVGSHALGASKIDLFTAAIEAWLFHIADIFNTHAIPRLLKLNGIDPRYAPKLTFGSLQPIDLDAMGKFLSALSATGMPLFPDEELESHLRTAAGLPAKTSPPAEEIEAEEL
jgi:hypothetical protein